MKCFSTIEYHLLASKKKKNPIGSTDWTSTSRFINHLSYF